MATAASGIFPGCGVGTVLASMRASHELRASLHAVPDPGKSCRAPRPSRRHVPRRARDLHTRARQCRSAMVRHLPRHDGRRRLCGGRHRPDVHHAIDLQAVRLCDGAGGSRAAVADQQGGRGAERRRLQLDQSRSPNWCAAQSDDQCRCNRHDQPGRRRHDRSPVATDRILDRGVRGPGASGSTSRSTARRARPAFAIAPSRGC